MKNRAKHNKADVIQICENLSFAAAEAYKLLRTSVQYSFENNKGCKVIGITSSMRNEGKSSLSINLCYMLSNDRNRVLLLEGDMRLPNIAKRLGVEASPGLSDFLTGAAGIDEVVQKDVKSKYYSVVTSGIVPPNPSELLGSGTMSKLLDKLKESYDYIIVDLPPVNIVSDALAIAKYLDGFIFVVRSEYSTRQGVVEAMQKLTMVNARVLGFVLNIDGSGSGHKYDRYSKYGKYNKYAKYGKYEKEYYNSYEGSDRRANATSSDEPSKSETALPE